MENSAPSSNIVNPIKPASKMPMVSGIAVIIILIGLGVGWFVSNKKAISNKVQMSGAQISVSQTEAGVNDPTTIKDVTTATGTLATGGIEGEGAYHIDRPGGATQTVYLNSTTVNLSQFVSKKVQVWGQTIAAQHAPWLMDVMKIKVVQ